MSEHEVHTDHPLSAAIVVLIVAGVFGLIFSLMGGGWVLPVIVITVALVIWGMVTVLVLDKE